MASASPIQGEMEEPTSITREMFEKLGIETKPVEVEKSPLKESVETKESCETSNSEKCKDNVLSEPVGLVADAKLIIDESPSTYSQKETLIIADDSLPKETENEEQLAKSPPPALEENTIFNIATSNPTETILESSVEQDEQSMEASAAKVEEVRSQLSETSNYSGAPVADIEDDVSGKRDDFSAQTLDSKTTEGVETSTKPSLPKVEDQDDHITSDENMEASNLSREDKEREKISSVAHQASEEDGNIATSAEDDKLEDSVSNKKEDPQTFKEEMFNTLGIEAKADEIEESPSKELAEATKSCEANLEKCKNNILSEPVESAADGNLVTGDIQSTYLNTETVINDDSLSKKTENQQLAESPAPASKQNTISVIDSENPTETILKTSVEEDNQKTEASTARDEDIHTQLKEVSNFSGARVVEKKDEFTGKEDESFTEGSDDKTQGIKTDPETSPLEVDDQDGHTKSAENVGASDLSSSEDKEEEKFINLEHQALEEDTNIATTAEDDNLEDSNLNETEEPQKFQCETLDKDGIEEGTAEIEKSLSKEVETIESRETDIEKLKVNVPSEPVELAAGVNLIVSEVQSSHGGSLNKASLEEDEAPFDKIETDKRTENEDSSEGDQCGKLSEVDKKADPEEEKVEITKADELLDVSELLASEEKTQAVAEKTTIDELVKANEVLNEQINEVVEKSFTNVKEDDEKENVTQTEGLATETSDSGNNGKDIPVFEPKPQDNLSVSDSQSHVPEILQECQNQDLENQKSQTVGGSCELDAGDENKEMVGTEQLTEKSCQPNEKSSLGDKLDHHVNDTLQSGSSTGGLDLSNKYPSVDEIYGEEALKRSGDGDSVNELANEKAIEYSVPQQEESINEEVDFTAVPTGGNVKSCEDSNKEHDEEEPRILQENIVETKEKNAEDELEPVTINEDQSTHSQNETPISDDSLSGETGNEQLAKPPPPALDVHTISVTDSEKPAEPILETSVEEDIQSIESTAAKVEEIHNESSKRSKYSGTVVTETMDDVTEKKEFPAERSYDKIASEIDTETILSEEKNDQTTSDENEGTIVKSEEEEKDDKFSNIATEALEDDSPGDNNLPNKWNERTLDLEEPTKEKQKGEEASTTFGDDQNNETSESHILLGIREDVKSEKEENLVNDKKLEEDYKLNSEDKLESVDTKENVVEKEDSATNLQKGAASEEFHDELTNQRNYCESSETPEKYKTQSKEDKINMLDADGKTIIDDLRVEAPKPQVEASNTLPTEQDFVTVATAHVIESECSVDADDSKNLNNASDANIRPAKEIDKELSEMHLDGTDLKKSKLIQETTIEVKEDMEMEKVEKQYESASKEPNHEASSEEQYPIVEVPIKKEFADEMVHNALPLQVSEDVEQLSTSEPIEHTKEIDSVNESIINPASVEAEKEGSIDVREISDCEHIVQTQTDGHIDDQLTLESEESLEGASLGGLTSKHVHIEDASASAQDCTEMKEVGLRSDPEETTFQTEEPAGNKEPLVQDDESLITANRDQSAEIQKPDEDENKEDLFKNIAQGKQTELIPQEVNSSDEDMASQKTTDGQQQVQDIDNITINLDPSKVEQDSRTVPSENNDAVIQNTSAVGDKNSTLGDLSVKHNYDEKELVQSTEGHELESVVEGGCQEQPTHLNEVIEETEDKWEEITEPHSVEIDEKLNDPNITPEVKDQYESTVILQGIAKEITEPHSVETDEKLNDPNTAPAVEGQHESTVILQGVPKDESITRTTIIDPQEEEHDSGDNSFSSKKDEENQDASAVIDQNGTIADPDETQNNETASTELTERNEIETFIGGYPEEQHANDATKETGDEISIRHEELTTDHSIEKEQNNEVATDTGDSGSMGHEELSIEKEQNLKKQPLSMEVEDIQETVTTQCITEDKQLPGQITDMTKELDTEEKEQNPVTASSETASEDSFYSKKDDDSKGELSTLGGTGSIRDDDEKHQDEEQPMNLTKREYDATTEGISEEQPIQASEVIVEAGESSLTSYGAVPKDHLSEKEETLNKHTTTSEATNSQEATSSKRMVEEQQRAGHVTDATTELDQELNVVTTSSETTTEDLTSNKENEDCKGDSAKVDGTCTMEAEDEKHGDKTMSIKLTEINEKETITEGCSEEEKICASEAPMDAGERGLRRYEEITQQPLMRPEELAEEPSLEKEENLSKQTVAMEVECIQQTLAPQIVSEDKQLPEQIIDVTKELNTEEKEQNFITASSKIAVEDSFNSKKDEDSKGNLATVDGTGSIEAEDEKHHDEEQPIKLSEKNEYEDVVEGRHEEQQIHASEVTVKGGKSGLVSYEEVPEYHFIEKEETLSKQTTTSEATDSQETSSPKKVQENQQLTGHVTDVTVELDQVGKGLNVITTSSEIAVRDFTSNKEDDDSKGDSAKVDGTGIMGAESEKHDDEKQSIKLSEINEQETTFKTCPEEEQICASVPIDAGESGSKSYDEIIQHTSIEKEQALSKPTTVLEVTEDQQLDRHATEVTSELGQDKNELNFVSTKSETTLEDSVSEKENGDSKGISAKVDGIGSMEDEDYKNGDEEQSIKLAEKSRKETIIEDRLEDQQICASELTTEAGHSGSMRCDELTKHHPVDKEQTSSELTNSQDAHTLERAIEDQQPIEHITDDTTELDQEEKEQNFVTASSETALEDTFGSQEYEEREGASAPMDDLGSTRDEVGKHGDKEQPMECAERNTLGMMAETDLEKHPANPKEITQEAGDVGLIVCAETAEHHLTDKDLLNEPTVTSMVELDIHKKEEESIHVANDEGECTRSEHVKNDDQMLDREVIVKQPEKLELNVTADDVLVDKSSQADSTTEHREERRNQEVDISDSTTGEKNIETTAATITEVESCVNEDSEKLDTVEHPDGNNKQIDPQEVTGQKEKAPNSGTAEEVILDNKLQVDETKDTSGNDGQNVMKEEAASESRIQDMAVLSSEEILEELKVPGILDDTEEHATKKVKDMETSDTQLSQEDMVDDRIQTEENNNRPNDARNPDKQTSEAEVIFCTIKDTNQVEIKDSALEPTDGVLETSLTSDALQKANLTKDEDSAFKTNDELITTVTTLTEINTEEEVSAISKNEHVDEEVNKVTDTADLMEEEYFKDEKDKAKKELETKIENAETLNYSVDFTETTAEHTENTEDKAKVWKVEKASTSAMETKIDEATLADKTYTEMPTVEKNISDGISEKTKPKEDETSLVSACVTPAMETKIDEATLADKTYTEMPTVEKNISNGISEETKPKEDETSLVSACVTPAMETKIDEATLADKTYTEMTTVENISDGISEETKPKEDETSLVSACDTTKEEKVEDSEEIEIVKKDIELNKTMGQAQEAPEEVVETKVDDTNFAGNTSLEPPTVETSISDGLVEANKLKHDDNSSVSFHEIIQEKSIKEEEEEIIKRDEGQPPLRVESADTSHHNIESAISAVLPIEKTEEKEVSENLEEASQLGTGLKSDETPIVDETMSESTAAETNGSDDFVHVGKPGDEEKGSFSGFVSTPDELVETKDKSINETSEVLVEELVHEENRKETVEKDKEQDINAENSNSEVSNEDTKSLSTDGVDRKHETAHTVKGCSGLSPPEEFTSVVLNEESKPKDEQYSSAPTTETNDSIDRTRQLKEEESLKDAPAVFSADKSCKETDEENVDHCEKTEEKAGPVESDQRIEAILEKEAQGLPHAMHQATHLAEQNNEGQRQDNNGLEEGKIEAGNQAENTDKNVGRLSPDPVSITSDAPEAAFTAAAVEGDKLAVNTDGEEEKTDEEKEQVAEHAHKEEEPESDAPVIVEASREAKLKPSPKKSHNLLSGVGSKVKHSISKVKKAITGKSSHSKSAAPKSS